MGGCDQTALGTESRADRGALDGLALHSNVEHRRHRTNGDVLCHQRPMRMRSDDSPNGRLRDWNVSLEESTKSSPGKNIAS